MPQEPPAPEPQEEEPLEIEGAFELVWDEQTQPMPSDDDDYEPSLDASVLKTTAAAPSPPKKRKTSAPASGAASKKRQRKKREGDSPRQPLQ